MDMSLARPVSSIVQAEYTEIDNKKSASKSNLPRVKSDKLKNTTGYTGILVGVDNFMMIQNRHTNGRVGYLYLLFEGPYVITKVEGQNVLCVLINRGPIEIVNILKLKHLKAKKAKKYHCPRSDMVVLSKRTSKSHVLV